MGYAVMLGRRELAVRLALGADPTRVRWDVVRRGLRLAVAALLPGLLAALLLGRGLAGLLYGVQPADPLALSAVALLLTGVALAGCYLPALRASRTDPLSALRQE
jgi:putative ABC transport system permease protein